MLVGAEGIWFWVSKFRRIHGKRLVRILLGTEMGSKLGFKGLTGAHRIYHHLDWPMETMSALLVTTRSSTCCSHGNVTPQVRVRQTTSCLHCPGCCLENSGMFVGSRHSTSISLLSGSNTGQTERILLRSVSDKEMRQSMEKLMGSH